MDLGSGSHLTRLRVPFNSQGRDLTTTPPNCPNYSYQTCQFRPQLSGNCTVAHAHLHLQALIVTSSQSPRVAIFIALVCFANVVERSPSFRIPYHNGDLAYPQAEQRLVVLVCGRGLV